MKMTAEEMEKFRKHTQMSRLLYQSIDNFPPNLMQFFDAGSDKLLDEKIEVLTALNEGKTIDEIPNFYDILELYPGDDVMWD